MLIAATVIALRHNRSHVSISDAEKPKELAPSRIGMAVIVASLMLLSLETLMSVFLGLLIKLHLYDPFPISFGELALLRLPPIELMAFLVSSIAIVGFWQANRSMFYLGFGTSLVLLVPSSCISLMATTRGMTVLFVFAVVWLIVFAALVIHHIWSLRLPAHATGES